MRRNKLSKLQTVLGIAFVTPRKSQLLISINMLMRVLCLCILSVLFRYIYMCDLSSYDYVWGIINYGIFLLRFCFSKKKGKSEKEKEIVG